MSVSFKKNMADHGYGLKMRWKIVDTKPQEKKFCVHAMTSELSWRQMMMIWQIIHTCIAWIR